MRLRYHEQDDGHVSQVVFASQEPRTSVATTPQPDAESAEVRLVEMLSEYSEYQRNGAASGLQRDHPELAIVAGGDEED